MAGGLLSSRRPFDFPMPNLAEFIGVSAAANLVREQIEYAATSDAKVLVTGESGVGKDVVAHAIHQRSRRAAAPLVVINCAGVPDTLLASELFGHVRGSFTDAYRDKAGWLEQANRGTIFMDEIAEMSLQMQSLLLRFLENGEIQRVGSDRRTTKVDVRVIAATNRRLPDRIETNEFREDLYYRLNVIHIEIPPLRERREDIPVLLDHFLGVFSRQHGFERPRLCDDAAAQLAAAAWPGNVRQLRNVAERFVVRAPKSAITVADLPREFLSLTVAPAVRTARVRSQAEVMFERMVRDGQSFWTIVYEPFMSRDVTREDIRALVRHALSLTRGNYKAVAQLFNVPNDQKRLINFLRKYQCHLPIQEFRAVSAQLADNAPIARAAGD